MAGLAYVFPPISGLIVFIRGSSTRARFHGLQAVLLGVLWPALLWVAALASPVVVAGVAVLGLASLLGLGVAASIGRDVAIGPVGRRLMRAAEEAGRTPVDRG